MVYAVHHLSALAGAFLTCVALLHGKAWTRSHPLLAVGLWHLLMLTACLSLFGLLVSIAFQALGLGVAPALSVAGRGGQNLAELSMTEAAALAAAVLLVVLTLAIYASSTLQRRRARERHRSLLSIVADHEFGPMTVIDHSAMLVYALPGRDPQIVATSAVVQDLSEPELHAVLAHENHHLSAHHDLALLPFSMLRRAFNRSTLLAVVETEVEFLLEMCADDYAARRGHRVALLGAMDLFAGRRDTPLATPVRDCTDTAWLMARRKRLGPRHSRSHLAMAIIAYLTAVTFASTTLSLYFLPI